jgi:hypothetical protein
MAGESPHPLDYASTPQDPKTLSVLAVASLLLAFFACPYVVGQFLVHPIALLGAPVLPVFLGFTAVIRIARSDGRLKGEVVAMIAIGLGLLWYIPGVLLCIFMWGGRD